MNPKTTNLVLQRSWQALVLYRPTLFGLSAFRDAVFKAQEGAGMVECVEFREALIGLARLIGVATLSADCISGIGHQMEVLQAAARRADDGFNESRSPAAIYIPGFGERAGAFAESLVSSGFQLLSLEPGASPALEPSLGERIPASGTVLVGDGVLEDPTVSNALSTLAAKHESDMLVVIVADRALSFEQRVRATEFGAVRILGLDTEPKALRTLIRSRARDSELNGFRVLLLDDSRTDAYVAQKFMQAEGLLVEHIQNPGDVLEAIERFRPDVVVTDFYMPGVNGDQVASVIRQDHEATMPIVYLSSERNAETQLLALSKGGDAFVQKPLKRGAFITALKALISRSKAAETLMRRDPLTGLLNHAQFLTSAARACASQSETPACLVMLDIDHFKSVNDTFGHPIGDRVIVGLAEILADNLRATDLVGRIGGEEFAVVMLGAGVSEAKAVIDRLRVAFAALQFDGSDAGGGEVWFTCTFSAGVAPLSKVVGDCLRESDECLYLAKSRGRNQVVVKG
ncbi:diguanylate cyclase [Pseudomonas sp. NCHU5208]|uniref:GGDEF domain-containing protein n=1 Tax=unclassified Pseudomonas TaxID=196821 RepID=UPI003F9D6CD7